MNCWKCDQPLNLGYQSDDFIFKFYHCDFCDCWYEMKKERAKINGAMPITVREIDSKPDIPLAA